MDTVGNRSSRRQAVKRRLIGSRRGRSQDHGFSLVVTVAMMVLLTLLAVGLLSLSTISLRASNHAEARATAMANARLGLALAIGQLQSELGDDRRGTADASILASTQRPAAVGVWNGWSPSLGKSGGEAGSRGANYQTPKGEEGFRRWLVSDPDPSATRQLDWHKTAGTGDQIEIFRDEESGFDMNAGRIPVEAGRLDGAVAWAVLQENTKARINVGTDENRRFDPEDRLQTPSRPNLALSSLLKQPEGDWTRRAARVTSMAQAALDPAYGATGESMIDSAEGLDYTAHSLSVLSNPVDGGLKVDLSTGFELEDSEFAEAKWSDGAGEIDNPFRSDEFSSYKGERPLWRPLTKDAEAKVFMNFPPASVNHKFQVNGVPTFDSLRNHYRIYRHLYESGGGEVTAFERPYSHVSTPTRVSGQPFGVESHPSLAPVLDRMNLFFSVYAKSDGTLGILLTPVITLWNPHNVALETEGVVVYPWIDFAVFWNWSVTPSRGGTMTWKSTLARFVGEGYQGHGRSSRPYFYLHLTKNGEAAPRGSSALDPLRLEPGEVRVFTLAENERRDLLIYGSPIQRTWRMKPAEGPSDITRSLKNGIVLDMTKSIQGGSDFNYKLQTGDRVNANTVSFDRGTYYYIVNMADSFHIKNPRNELMAETRPADSGLPMLREERNLYLHAQIHSGAAFGKGDDSFSYPAFRFEEIRDNPKLVGSLLTYHRVAHSGTLPLSDLMYTTNPRQGMVNPYLSGAKFQTGPHYETLFRGGTSLAQLAMETTFDGEQAFYGPSHSAASGLPYLAFFDVPRTPTLSLGALQHCDMTTTAFSTANQVGNSWASAYLPASTAAELKPRTSTNESITPQGLAVYDASFLANEALFDGFFFSGATPTPGTRRGASGSPQVWNEDLIGIEEPVTEVLERFFDDPIRNPLRNPRMTAYRSGYPEERIKERLDGAARCVRLASHLLVEGGFNVNSTSVEAWKAMLLSLRGSGPGGALSTPQSRFRHILTQAPLEMRENDNWSGFRTLDDEQIEELAKLIVDEVKRRGPFLSLGEFVNRQASRSRTLGGRGAIQSAIDRAGLNKGARQASFNRDGFPNPENIIEPDTGVNLPGWLSQADVLTPLAPFLTTRSDTFIVRSVGEARDDSGRLLAQVRLEAVVQRVPDFVNPTDPPETRIEDLVTENQRFGRRFRMVSCKELP